MNTVIIAVLTAIIIQETISLDNLIKQPDFQFPKLGPTDLISGTFYRKYVNMEPQWYSNSDVTPKVQIRTIDTINLNQMMDISYSNVSRRLCQNVSVTPSAKLSLSFDGVAAPGILNALESVFWNLDTIFSPELSELIGRYQTIIPGEKVQELNQLCFRGYNLDTNLFTGIMIDNLELTIVKRIETIFFMVQTDNITASKIYAYGNYSLDPENLSMFDNVTLNNDNQTINVSEVFLFNNSLTLSFQLNGTLEQIQNFTIDLTEAYYLEQDFTMVVFESFSEIIPRKEEYQQNGTSVVPIEQNSKQVQQDGQQYQEEVLGYLSSLDFSIVESGMENVVGVKNIMVLLLATAFFFKFINFANIMVLYIFLDIGLLDQTVRIIFQSFAKILIKDGVITSIYLMIYGHPPSFLEFSWIVQEKIPSGHTHSGSAFSIIELTTNIAGLCLEDLTLIVINGAKIWITYLIISRLSNQEIKMKRRNLKKKLLKAFYIQIISVSPLWMLAIGMSINYLGFAQISSKNYIQKINQSILLLVPLVFLGFIVGWRIVEQKIETSCVETSDARLIKLQMLSRRNKQRLQRYQVNLDWFDMINYMCFGFMLGAFPTLIVLLVSTIIKLGCWWYLIRKMKKQKFYIVSLIRKIFESLIHFGFLTLFILQEKSDQPSQLTRKISIGILFAYISGCIFQIIMFIIEFLIDSGSFISFMYRSCKENQKISQIGSKPNTRERESNTREREPNTKERESKDQKPAKQSKKQQKQKNDKNQYIIDDKIQQQQYKGGTKFIGMLASRNHLNPSKNNKANSSAKTDRKKEKQIKKAKEENPKHIKVKKTKQCDNNEDFE